MNLQTLREELTTRATAADDQADLLPGVRRKIRRTKQRRVATALGTVAAIAALTVALVPSVVNTSTPDPAEDVPPDYSMDGVTLHGAEGPDRLEKGWIGAVGENAIDFDWTPSTHNVALYVFCRSTYSTPRYYVVRINKLKASVGNCVQSEYQDTEGNRLSADDSLWLDAPIGKPAAVDVQLVDAQGRPTEDSTVQLALGIYRSGSVTLPGPPSRTPPTDPADYEKDGVRYRSRFGGDTLVAAQVADRGRGQVSLSYDAAGKPLVLHSFCTADRTGFDPGYQVRISINGVVRRTGSCASDSVDAVQGSALTLYDLDTSGQATATLVDRTGRPVSVPQARIGLAVYQKGAHTTIDGVMLDQLTEYNGYTYRLADVRTADATRTTKLAIPTPAGQPFLVAFGSSSLGPGDIQVGLGGGLNVTGMVDSGGGISITGEAARDAGTVSVVITKGKPTKGKLILGVYLPN